MGNRAAPLPEMPNSHEPCAHLAGSLGYDLRTFECGTCEHVLKEVISTDPMNSDKAGWLAAELKAPE
jgi:hypothetical protein